MKKRCSFGLLLVVFLTTPSFASLPEGQPGPKVSKGEIIDKYEPENPEILFTQTRTVEKSESGYTVTKIVKNKAGDVALTEKWIYRDGKAIRYELDQKQIAAKGFFEVKDGKVFFTYTKDGETDKDSEDLAKNMVSTDEIAGHLQSRWESIIKGDNVEIRLPVLDRQETVGFKFFKVREEKRPDGDVVVVKMKPQSFIIAALVDPLFFYFKKDGWHELIEVDGRTAPKIKKDGDWKDLDAILKLRTVEK